MSLFGNLLGNKNKQPFDCENESTDLAEMATDSEVKKVSEAELVDYAKHYDKDLAHKLLKKLRKATRDKPKVVAGTSAAIVTTPGTLLSALDNPETPVARKMFILGAIGYIVLPLDLIPDLTPMLGYGDDLASAAGVVTAVTMYSNFSMEELDREIDAETIV